MKATLTLEQTQSQLQTLERERLLDHLCYFARYIDRLERILKAHGININTEYEQNRTLDKGAKCFILRNGN